MRSVYLSLSLVSLLLLSSFERPIRRCEDVEGTIFTKPKTYLECENYCQSNYRQKYIALRRQWSYKARWGMVNTTIHD